MAGVQVSKVLKMTKLTEALGDFFYFEYKNINSLSDISSIFDTILTKNIRKTREKLFLES